MAACFFEACKNRSSVVRFMMADGSTIVREMSCEATEDGWKTILRMDEIPQEAVAVALGEEVMNAQAGDEGYYVVPSSMQRIGCFLTRFTQRADNHNEYLSFVMPIFARSTGKEALLAVVTGMGLDYKLVCGTKDGHYYMYPRIDFDDYRPYEDIVIQYMQLQGEDADYSGIARRYRRFKLDRGDCRPYAERAKDNPLLQYAADCFSIRLRLGWKPRPTPVVYQTRENEPEMRVVMPFAKVEHLMEEFQRQGIDKAEFLLVGWNSKGHDGRFPQHFPIEEELGGEEGFLKVIETGRRLGYPVDSFTNSTCAYRVADCWDEELVVKNKDGSLFHAVEFATGSGVEYRICPKRAYDFSEEVLSKLGEMGSTGLHYIDVISVVEPFICHDERHPCTRAQSVEYYHKIMAKSKKYFGGSSSEGGWDCYADDIDYALYIDFDLESAKKRVPMCDEHIPLWQLVYHGIIMSNPNSLTVNYPAKGPKAMLQCVEYGARPVIYYYGSYCDPDPSTREDNIGNWMGDVDIRCDTEEDLVESVRLIKREYDRYRTMSRLQMEFMEEHKTLAEDVKLTRYSDGTVIVCNYSDQPYEYEGHIVGAMDYVLMEP